MSARTERRLAAIMFTDIVGYTSLAQTNEAQAVENLESYRRLLRSVFQRFNGQEVKTIGDGFLVEFPSALDAVRCSVEIQQEMHDRNASVPENKRLLVRVGVHVGDVIHSQGDILGDAVNVSARIEPLAEPGGVCISEQVYDHVKNKVEYPFVRLEPKTLKNVKTQVDIYRVVMPWETDSTRGDDELDTRRVAVLPLKNMSPDPNDEYFADGMTEELITSLSAIKEFTVIARTSVMQYKTVNKRIDEIGRELGAGTLIEGSVRKAGDKVRISIQLIDARNQGHLWAQNYDKKLDDVFAIQSEVAQKVAEEFKVKLMDSDVRRLERGSTKNVEAHNLYLKGMFYWNKRSPEGMSRAIEFFEEAIRLDPSFALGYAGLAQCYHVMAANYMDDPEATYQKAKEAALKALSLNEDLSEAHAVLAVFHIGYDRDPVRCEAEFRRAIDLNPNYASAHQWYAQLLLWEHRYDESRREVMRALELNPLSLVINTNMGDFLYYTKQFDEAIAQFKKVIDMDPGFSAVYASLIQAYLAKSMFTEAHQALQTLAKLEGESSGKLESSYVYASTGNADEAHRLLSQIEPGFVKEHLNPYVIALIHFLLGENDAGFEWLERAYSDHVRLVYAMTVDFELEGVRSDQRYRNMLERLGLVHHVLPA